MGEIADSMIDGEFDYISGEYLGKGVGYPRTRCNSKKRKSKVTPPCNKSQVWALMFPKGNPANLSEEILFLIVEEYAHQELKLPDNIKESTAYKHIAKDKQRFSKWYELKYPQYAKYLKP